MMIFSLHKDQEDYFLVEWLIVGYRTRALASRIIQNIICDQYTVATAVYRKGKWSIDLFYELYRNGKQPLAMFY